MGLLISYVFGAVSAAGLIIVVLRRHAGGDPGVADSLGELRGLLDGVSRQQERMVTEATQWNQLLGHAGDRGRWGDLTLQNLVEAAGLREHVDFDVQVHVSDGERSGRPDLVLRLPTGGCVPVDSKATWEAYQDSLNAEEPGTREELLAKHARNVRSCVQTLAQKAYWSQFPMRPRWWSCSSPRRRRSLPRRHAILSCLRTPSDSEWLSPRPARCLLSCR